jgi:hypothetical protein
MSDDIGPIIWGLGFLIVGVANIVFRKRLLAWTKDMNSRSNWPAPDWMLELNSAIASFIGIAGGCLILLIAIL